MVGLVVAGLVVAGLGVASATVWRPSDTAVMTTGAVSTTADASEATLLTTAPGVLSLVDEDVTVTARSSEDATVVIAVGSQVDVEGWVGDDPARVVTGASDWETLTVSTVETSGEDEATDEAATDDAATEESADAATDTGPVAPGPNPAGSDMWVTSTSGTGSASLRWDASSTDQVMLVAAVGEDAAAPQLTLSWPREVTTPLLWPGVALGVLLVVLGLLYGLLVGRRRRSGAPAPARSAGVATTDDAPATGTLTRRQLREQAEREQQEAADAAARPKRQWPWTGAIPVVKPADEQDSAGEKTAVADPAPEPHRPAWLPEGTGSTSGSSWRAAWGVRTPDAADPATPPAQPGAPAGSGSDAPTGAAASSAVTSGGSSAPAATGSTAAAAVPSTVSAPSTPSGRPTPSAPAKSSAPTPATPSPAPGASPAAAAGPPTSGAVPAPTRPASGPSVAKPATQLPPARPVDQASPFQRITLRSGDESAPARRIRREQQPSAWSAPRSPWAQKARPPVAPTDGAGAADAPSPTDDTTKDSE